MKKVQFYSMLFAYLIDEIELLTDNEIIFFTNGFLATKITCMASKAELQKQMISWANAPNIQLNQQLYIGVASLTTDSLRYKEFVK